MTNNPQELLTQLSQFTGSENLYRHWLGIFYTDGVHHLAEAAGAHWLIDAVASYQNTPQITKDPLLCEFQLWELHVNVGDRNGDLRCLRDTDDVAFNQIIPFTDFPLPHQKLYVRDGILMLPSEY